MVYLMNSNSSVFRAYDIRGIYGKDIDDEFAKALGATISRLFGKARIVVGRDVRPSSKELFEAFTTTLVSSGMSVIDIGEVPSPVLYYSARKLGMDLGIMITASHLPPEWNGFKFCDSLGIVMSEGTGLEKIRTAFRTGHGNSHNGGSIEKRNMIREYTEHVSGMFTTKRRMRIAVDYGNSVTSLVMPHIFRILGFDAIEINRELDGTSPNRASEPSETSLQSLREAVIEHRAEAGIGYDGDGDRVAFVDHEGKIHSSGNMLIPILAGHYLRSNPGGCIVYDVTCSSSVDEYIASMGGRSIITRVGHSYCASEVLKSGALFGGQYSGHLSFPEMGCSDDAMFASLKILQIISESGKTLTDLVSEIPKKQSTGIYEYPVSDGIKFTVMDRLYDNIKESGYRISRLDGVKIFRNGGWVLIRPSNTSSLIRINTESNTAKEAKTLMEFGKELVREAMNND